MKTDTITVTNTGEGMAAAMEQASASAAFRGLTGKDALHLRLLAEEMLGMIRQITGETEALFWIESEGKSFQLHLVANPIITGGMRKELLSVSSTGKNAAAVGVMGKLRDVFERAFDAVDLGAPGDYSRFYVQGLMVTPDPDAMDPTAFALSASLQSEAASWSMQKYMASVEKEKGTSAQAQEDWDELEKSIIANLADEVSIAIRSGKVEMIVYKKF